ncbi:MAG TPA: hypothetical protein VE863_10950 [Pyrinomonadaceae bacterium]|jgi:hypothetical protein|nr:hypothetical protein [Pyrinomonadaceae bacterium]
MKTDQTNRVNMYKTVTGVLDDHSAVWNAMAPMVTAVADFKTKVSTIDTAVQKQETPTGATKDKAEARDALEDVLFLMCRALSFLAHKSGDNDLSALADLTRSDIDKFDSEGLSNRAASVLAQANAKKTDLATVQVTQANLDELTQALADFNEVKAGPRQATAERAAQTESLPTLIRDANSILRNEVDPLVALFSRSNPDFVSAYNSARVIVDRAATHAAAKALGGPPPTPAQ